MGTKTARAKRLPFLETLGLYHFAASCEGEAYLLTRLSSLDADTATLWNGHYRPRRVLAPTFRRLVARPATMSFHFSRARSCATVSPALRRCLTIMSSS